jgi:hypothetical protein
MLQISTLQTPLYICFRGPQVYPRIHTFRISFFVRFCAIPVPRPLPLSTCAHLRRILAIAVFPVALAMPVLSFLRTLSHYIQRSTRWTATVQAPRSLSQAFQQYSHLYSALSLFIRWPRTLNSKHYISPIDYYSSHIKRVIIRCICYPHSRVAETSSVSELWWLTHCCIFATVSKASYLHFARSPLRVSSVMTDERN